MNRRFPVAGVKLFTSPRGLHKNRPDRNRIKFMAEDVSEILKKALALPSEARAALAGSLLESLDDTVDQRVEEQWTIEIARRVEELNSGKVKPLPWETARRQIFTILNSC